jgi:hypothetical protein
MVVQVVNLKHAGPVDDLFDKSGAAFSATRQQRRNQLFTLAAVVGNEYHVGGFADDRIAGFVGRVPDPFENAPGHVSAAEHIAQPEELRVIFQRWPGHLPTSGVDIGTNQVAECRHFILSRPMAANESKIHCRVGRPGPQRGQVVIESWRGVDGEDFYVYAAIARPVAVAAGHW